MNGIRHSSTFRYHQSKIFEKLSKSKKLATQFNQERTKFDTMTVRYKKKIPKSPYSYPILFKRVASFPDLTPIEK